MKPWFVHHKRSSLNNGPKKPKHEYEVSQTVAAYFPWSTMDLEACGPNQTNGCHAGQINQLVFQKTVRRLFLLNSVPSKFAVPLVRPIGRPKCLLNQATNNLRGSFMKKKHRIRSFKESFCGRIYLAWCCCVLTTVKCFMSLQGPLFAFPTLALKSHCVEMGTSVCTDLSEKFVYVRRPYVSKRQGQSPQDHGVIWWL